MDRAIAARIIEVFGGRSQSEMSRTLGVSQRNISRYVNGAMPSAEFLVALVEKEGVDITWLLTGQGGPHGADKPEATDLGKIPAAQLVAEINRRVALAMGMAAEAAAVSQEMLQHLDKLLRTDDEEEGRPDGHS